MSKSTECEEAMSRLNVLPTDIFNHVLTFRETYRQKMFRCFEKSFEELEKLTHISILAGNFFECFNLKTWGISMRCRCDGAGHMIGLDIDVICSKIMSVTFTTEDIYAMNEFKWELEDFCEKNFPGFDEYTELW